MTFSNSSMRSEFKFSKLAICSSFYSKLKASFFLVSNLGIEASVLRLLMGEGDFLPRKTFREEVPYSLFPIETPCLEFDDLTVFYVLSLDCSFGVFDLLFVLSCCSFCIVEADSGYGMFPDDESRAVELPQLFKKLFSETAPLRLLFALICKFYLFLVS